MNGYCVGAREYLEHPARERFISLSAINTSLHSIDVDGRDCRPLIVDHNIRDLVCECICASAKLWITLDHFFVRPFVTNLAPNSNISFSPTSDCARSFFVPPLFAYSIRHDSIPAGEGDLPPARSCTVTGVDDLSLSSSVISVGRTRWHLAVKNISSADMPQARALFVRSPRQSRGYSRESVRFAK